MAEAYKAGTVWIDVVPTIKGIEKELRTAFSIPVEKASAQVETTLTRALGKGAATGANQVGSVLDKTLGGQAKTVGAAIGTDMAAGMAKSMPAIRHEAKEAAKALTSADEKVKTSAESLVQARQKEEKAALAVEKAERILAIARRTGDTSRIEGRELALARAINAADQASRDAAKASSDYNKALVAQSRAASSAQEKQNALQAATQKASAQQAEAARQAQQQSTLIGRLSERVTGFGSKARASTLSVVNGVQSAIAPATSRLGSFMSAASNKVTAAAGIMGSALTGLGTIALAGLATGIGLVTSKIKSLIPNAIRASDATFKFGSTLKFAGLGANEIEQLKRSTQKYADQTVYELADIQNVTAQLASNAVPDYEKLAEAAGNLNAVAGGSAETFKSVGMVMTQTAGAGYLTGENWRQLSDAIPGASGRIQKALLDAGAYSGDFRKAMEDNEISAQEFYDAVKVLGLTDIAYEAATSTAVFEGAMGNLDAAITGGWVRVLDKVKAPATKIINAAATSMEPLFNLLERGAEKIAPFLERIGDGLTSIVEGKSNIGGILSGLLPVAGLAAGPVGAKLAEFIARIPVVGSALGGLIRTITGPIGLVVTIIVSMISRSEALRNALWGAFSRIGEALLGVLPAGDSVGSVFEWIGRAAGVLGDYLAPVVTWLGEILAVGIEFAGAGLGYAFEMIGAGVQIAGQWISDELIPSAKTAWEILTTGESQGEIFGLGQDSTVVSVLVGIRDAGIQTWEWISGTFIPGVQSLWTLLTEGDFDGNFFGLSEDSFLVDFLLDVRDIAILAGDAIGQFWTGLVWPVLQTLGSAVSNLWNNILKPIFDVVGTYISTIIAPIVTWLWENVISPAFVGIATIIGGAISVVMTVLKGVWWFIANVLAPVVTWLWQNIISPAFTAIQTVIGVVISAVSIVLQAFIVVIGEVGTWISDLWTQYVSPVFTWISDKISSVIGFIQESVFPPFQTVMSKLGEGFQLFKDTVGKAMDAVRSAAAKPINFVIQTVYTNGIKAAFDKIAETVGISTRMPSVKAIAGYAQGGVLPGYTPGRDVHVFTSPTGGVLHLSGGEGIIRPDSLRALGGKAWLDAVNASRGRGIASVGDVGSVQRFAEGGIWGGVKSFASSAWNATVDAVDFLGDVFSDPAGAIANLVRKPAEALLASMASSGWASLAKGIPSLLWDGLSSLFVSKANEIGGGGQALVNAARGAIGVPYIWGGSSIPPGVDCSGLVYWSSRQLSRDIARMTAAGYQQAAQPISWNSKRPGDLLFWGNPAWHVAINSGNGRMVEAPKPGTNVVEHGIWGNPTVGRLYDSGGYLPPGVSTVINKTGQPEPVLTGSQWESMKRLAEIGGTPSRRPVRLVVGNREFDAYVEELAGSVLQQSSEGISRASIHDHFGVS